MAYNNLRLLVFISLVFFGKSYQGSAQQSAHQDEKVSAEARIDSLLAQMTLQEKLDYIGGYNFLDIRPIPRLDIPQLYMSDGPVGVNEYGRTTAYPCGIMAASTWDTTLIRRLGVSLGRDARARGVHFLLAPGVNIYRAPMAGRNFEYFGEDPYLAARMAVSYINGVQSQRVGATVKHFAANNQEWDRHNNSSDLDERTLQEIYLPAFKAAVTEAKVAAVMDSYNLVNGTHATENGHLNNEILKQDWHFDGILMSDWHATYDGIAAANNGLDLEMPSGAYMNAENLLPAIKSGAVSETTIDDKVRRILRVMFRFGWYDKPQQDKTIPKDDPQSAATALQVAREGIVLLRNENHILPLVKDQIKTIAVIGPNAIGYIAGGGSSDVNPFHSTGLVAGIRKIAGKDVKVSYVPAALSTLEERAAASVYYTASGSEMQGLSEAYPESTTTSKIINCHVDPLRDIKDLPDPPFTVTWSGVIRPQKTGLYHFRCKAYGKTSLWLGGKKLPAANCSLQLDSGREYAIKLTYNCVNEAPQITFAWYPAEEDFSPAVAAAKKADVVIMAMGFNQDEEQENADRTFALPGLQDSLIRAISKVNSKTIVVLNAGGNVDMQKWLPQTAALIHAWYPGQEGGMAIAEVLFGKTNPSGKLTASFEKQWADNPTYNSYYDPEQTGHVQYKEGLFIGYRYWDTTKLQPQFPFGYGLSYTSFSYSHLMLSEQKDHAVLATFQITNTGSYDGAEVAELYVHQEYCPVIRPVKELKGFTRVFLKKGETKKVSIKLDSAAFSYYKQNKKTFGYDPGKFDILIGASSKDIRLTKTVMVN